MYAYGKFMVCELLELCADIKVTVYTQNKMCYQIRSIGKTLVNFIISIHSSLLKGCCTFSVVLTECD